MANRALINIAGITQQIQNGNSLYVGDAVERAPTTPGSLGVGTTTSTTILNLGTGTAVTQVDIGTGALVASINIGTGMALGDTITLGGGGVGGSLTRVAGDFEVVGAETILGPSTFADTIIIGDGTGTDTLSFFTGPYPNGGYLGSVANPNVSFLPEVAHVLNVGQSTTAATPGYALTIQGGKGVNSATLAREGGTLALTGGAGGDYSGLAGSSGFGADLQLHGGNAGLAGTGAGNYGGQVEILGGAATGTGLYPGGNVSIQGGLSASGPTGQIHIGDATASLLYIGNASATTDFQGNLTSGNGTINFAANGTSSISTTASSMTLDGFTGVSLRKNGVQLLDAGISAVSTVTVTGALSQSGGAINLTGNAASEIKTSLGAGRTLIISGGASGPGIAMTVTTADAAPETPARDTQVTAGVGGATAGALAGGLGGSVYINGSTGGAGSVTKAAGDGGSANFNAGDAGAANTGAGAVGGTVWVDAGLSTNGGANGVINIGTSKAEKVTIGRTGKTVEIGGNLSILGTFYTNSVDRLTAGTLTLGPATATLVEIGSSGAPTSVLGELDFSADIVGKKEINHSIYVAASTTADEDGGSLSAYGGNSSSGGVSANGGSITIAGGNSLATDGNGGGVGIDGGAKAGTGVGGSVTIGKTNAPVVQLGHASIGVLTVQSLAGGWNSANAGASSLTFNGAGSASSYLEFQILGNQLLKIGGPDASASVMTGGFTLQPGVGGGTGGFFNLTGGTTLASFLKTQQPIAGTASASKGITVAVGQGANSTGGASGAGGVLALAGGKGGSAFGPAGTSSLGGSASLTGGAGGDGTAAQTAKDGGTVTVAGGDAGAAPSVGADGGLATLRGGAATGNGLGGNVSIQGGLGAGLGAPGSISIGTTASKNITIGNTGTTDQLAIDGDGVRINGVTQLTLQANNADLLIGTAATMTIQNGVTLTCTPGVGGGMIDLPKNFQVFGVSTAYANPGTGAGFGQVTADNLNTLTAGSGSLADSLHYHTTGGASSMAVTLNTSTNSVTAGQCVYVDPAATATAKQAKGVITGNMCRVVGIREGTANKVTVAGIVTDALFVGSLTPALGDVAYVSNVVPGSLVNTTAGFTTVGVDVIQQMGFITDLRTYNGTSDLKMSVLVQPQFVMQV